MLRLSRRAMGPVLTPWALRVPLPVRRLRWPPFRPFTSRQTPPPSLSANESVDWLLPVLDQAERRAKDAKFRPLDVPLLDFLSASAVQPEQETEHETEPKAELETALATGLTTARRTPDPGNLRTDLYNGTTYELCVAAALSRLGFNLRRVGGRGDGGIDLQGTLDLPPPVPAFPNGPLRVIVQCKGVQVTTSGRLRTGTAGQLKPKAARELQGAFSSVPLSWRSSGSGVIGFLASTEPTTAGMRDCIARSLWPIGFIQVDHRGVVHQMVWNTRIEHLGLEHLGATQLFDTDKTSRTAHGGVVLTWNGERLWTKPPERKGAADRRGEIEGGAQERKWGAKERKWGAEERKGGAGGTIRWRAGRGESGRGGRDPGRGIVTSRGGERGQGGRSRKSSEDGKRGQDGGTTAWSPKEHRGKRDSAAKNPCLW